MTRALRTLRRPSTILGLIAIAVFLLVPFVMHAQVSIANLARTAPTTGLADSTLFLCNDSTKTRTRACKFSDVQKRLAFKAFDSLLVQSIIRGSSGLALNGSTVSASVGASTISKFGQWAANTTYNMLSLNNDLTDANGVGLVGGGSGDLTNVYVKSATGGAVKFRVGTSTLYAFDATGAVPGADNSLTLGSASFRWSDVRANTATFSSTVTVTKAIVEALATVTYSASMTPDASAANVQVITATNGTAFTINAPSNAVTGEFLTVTIRNTSGGALGAATWNAVFKMATWTQPANGFSRSITFRYDGTNWVEMYRAASDIPN